jgi:hypothetical protein
MEVELLKRLMNVMDLKDQHQLIINQLTAQALTHWRQPNQPMLRQEEAPHQDLNHRSNSPTWISFEIDN